MLARTVALLVACFLGSAPVAQSSTWVRKDLRGPAGGTAITAYDSARQRVVLFEDGTWEWDGVAWTRRNPDNEPPPRRWTALAYDSDRRVVVLFGGGIRSLGDTWEWDGVDWERRMPVNSPPPSTGHGLAYDPVRRRTLLVTDRCATWEWDGVNWTQRSPTNAPPARARFGLVWNERRQRAVLFGGQASYSGSYFDDTWEWDGTDWTRGPSGPPGRALHTMTYDSARGVVVVLGGAVTTSVPFTFTVENDLWEYGGTAWVQPAVANRPPRIVGATMEYDAARDELVLFGGEDYAVGRLGNTWVGSSALSGGDAIIWRQVGASELPQADASFGLAYDLQRERAVMFGGHSQSRLSADTAEWDGQRWVRINTTTQPSPRQQMAMTWDSTRGVTVLFGGDNFVAGFGDTWSWNGSEWTDVAPSSSPSPRSFAAMADDATRGELVLFGGAPNGSFSSFRRDTWVWDGRDWSRRFPINAPSVRAGHKMAYDPARRRMVLFGGADAESLLGDTWEWDGSNWTQRTPANAPTPRFAHAMAFDAIRSRVVLFGGDTLAGPVGDMWEWDGTDWTEVVAAVMPRPRYYHQMVSDARGQLLLFGAFAFQPGDPHWIYTRDPAADAAAYGQGCGAMRITAYRRPVLGAATFGIDVLDVAREATCAIALSPAAAAMPLGACTLLVGPPVTAFPVGANGFGFGHLPIPVPSNRALVGQVLFAQAFALGGDGWSSSRGLALTIGE